MDTKTSEKNAASGSASPAAAREQSSDAPDVKDASPDSPDPGSAPPEDVGEAPDPEEGGTSKKASADDVPQPEEVKTQLAPGGEVSSETKTVAAASENSAAESVSTFPSGTFPMDDFDDLPQNEALIGQTVAGRYKVLKKLGEGGMGIVFLAEHVTIEKRIALKVLLQEYARKPDIRDRFLQEAKAAARINHENIVDITDFGTTPDRSVFFAMEFLEGRDLSWVIRKEGPIHWSRAKPILLQICRALGAAHSKRIIHRDMKPENIHLIEREGRSDFVKLLDFGIAKMSVDDSEKKLTRTGMIFGTPEYMSPEQAQGNRPDHRVDIYAVGVIMYEMMTGHVPFKADTFMGILTKHIFENPVPPHEANPEMSFPMEVEGIILKAMAKDRDERFQTISEMSAAIAQATGRMTRPTGNHSSVSPMILKTAAQPGGSIGSPSVVNAISDPPTTGRGGSSKLALGVLGALVVIAGIVAMVLLQDDGTATGAGAAKKDSGAGAATAPDSAPPKKNLVNIMIRSNPATASIYRGGAEEGKKPLGVTPATIQLKQSDEGSVLITLRKEGYEDEAVSVPTRKDATHEIVKLRAVVAAKPTPESKPKRPHNKKPRPDRKKPQPRPDPRPDPKPDPKPTPSKVNDLMNPFSKKKSQ